MVLKGRSLDQQYQLHLGTYQKCKFLPPAPNLLNQKLWGQDPATCVWTSPPGDSDAHYILWSTVLAHVNSFIHKISELKHLYLPPPWCKIYMYLSLALICYQSFSCHKWLIASQSQAEHKLQKFSVYSGTCKYLACLYLKIFLDSPCSLRAQFKKNKVLFSILFLVIC